MSFVTSNNNKEIGSSKEHSLLECKSNLNDPKYWNPVLNNTGTVKDFDSENSRYVKDSSPDGSGNLC